MPDLDFAQLRELARKNKTLPWRVSPSTNDQYIEMMGEYACQIRTGTGSVFNGWQIADGLSKEEAEYAVAAANALPTIMDECERLRAENVQLKKQLERYRVRATERKIFD